MFKKTISYREGLNQPCGIGLELKVSMDRYTNIDVLMPGLEYKFSIWDSSAKKIQNQEHSRKSKRT